MYSRESTKTNFKRTLGGTQSWTTRFLPLQKAVVATVEREHYDDVAVIMVSYKIAEKINLDAVKADIHKLYAGKCLTSDVAILDQNSEEYKKKVSTYLHPENMGAVDTLMKELSDTINKNM